MTLLEFISALSTDDINISVVDSTTDKAIITFISQGYAGVESDLTARPVVSWSLVGAGKITVKIRTAEEP